MSFGAVRALSLSVNFDVHGVSATVTRPGQAAVNPKAIWQIMPQEETQPYGHDFTARGPRRVLLLKKTDFPVGVERGTTVSAPELIDGTAVNWIVDAVEQVQSDHWRVLVVRAT